MDELAICPANNLEYDHYLKAFEDIFSTSTSSEIYSELVRYIGSIIEPVGWKAVLKKKISTVSPVTCNFLVEVLDVSQTDLEADVQCVSCLSDVPSFSAEIQEIINKILTDPVVTIPLLELYPTANHDTSLYLEPTVTALHLIRIFYGSIWHPWDEELDDGSSAFVDTCLEPRLKMYFDIRKNVVPQKTVIRYESLILEGRNVVEKLNKLRNEMKADEDNMELDGKDVLNCMELTMRLETIKKETEMLENPLLRNLIKKQEIQILSPKRKFQRQSGKSVVHLVGMNITFGMIMELKLQSDDVILQHDNIASAVSSSIDGDKILIYPGCYSCEGLDWLESSVTLQGVGSCRNDTILEASADLVGDIFFNTSARNVGVSNITFQVSSGVIKDVIMVHSGTLTLDNVCVVSRAPAFVQSGITVLEGAYAETNNVVVKNVEGCAFKLYNGSSSSLRQSSVDECSIGCTICVNDNNSEDSNNRGVILNIQSCKFQGSKYGVLVTSSPTFDISEPDSFVKPSIQSLTANELNGFSDINAMISEDSEVYGKEGAYVFRKTLHAPVFNIKENDAAMNFDIDEVSMKVEYSSGSESAYDDETSDETCASSSKPSTFNAEPNLNLDICGEITTNSG